MRLLLFALLLAVVASGQPLRRAVVVEPVLNMYSKASLDADVVSQAGCATTVEIVEESGEWRHIRTPDEYPGWVHSSGLRALTEQERYPGGDRFLMVESLAAHLYREPSVTKHSPLLTVPFETVLEVVSELPGEQSRWIEVRLPDTRRAFIQRGDLTDLVQPRPLADLITLARRMMGRPYTWGGTTSFGYDCSGFTQMLCRRGGRIIPRDSRKQAAWNGMAAVERENLQPGDLLYFGPSLEKVNHTGFYIGGGEFIHATTNSQPAVQISRLDEEHWTRLLVACRRWLQQ